MTEELSAGTTLIFRVSLHQTKNLNAWRDALISPLCESGNTDRRNPENYRLISLTSVSCKLLENIIHSNVMEHLNHNDIITDVQHGIQSKLSCETKLIKSVHDLSKTLNDGELIDSILTRIFKSI